MFVVPAVAVRMIKEPVEQQYDLSSLRLLRIGAAPTRKDVIEGLVDKLGCMVIQMYGLTEGTLCTHGNTFNYNKEGSIGVVQPFVECKVYICLFHFLSNLT